MENEEKRIGAAEPAGLSSDEVSRRIEQGLVNVTKDSAEKTTGQIIKSNLLTYFNLIFLLIAVVLCLVGSFKNLTFLPLVIANSLIGIVQELRAKQILNKMSLLNAPHAVVLRNGVRQKVNAEELVQDDVILLSAGDQICADAEVLQGSVQVNEALLTGEADEIEKTEGASLLSGSFVVSGQCYARLTKVGEESFIAKLTKQAKAVGSGEQSEMVHSINRIVKWAGIAVIPIGAVLFCQSYFLNQETVRRSVVSAVAAVLGMIPEGLYRLTTIALVLSAIRRARKKVRLHDMHSIEALARVDVLCVDKTGTITEPEMRVSRVQPMDEGSAETFHTRLCDYAAASIDNNATMLALKQYAQQELQRRPHTAERAVAMQPFSSREKYGSVTFADGRYLLGAPEFVLREAYPAVAETLTPYSEAGGRVLLLARETENGAPEALGFVVLENPIRENAKQTFAYFKEQGVTVKVISGDNPVAVSRIAADAGIENAERWLDASAVHSDEQLVQAAESYTVFGRVTPQQKQLLVRALQDAGHTVAMTGDGVNDILAMKDADCSVAMASGSEAAAQSAQVVLLESDFARMPEVVLEGRRVVNNIQRSASLFLVKNIFSLMMALFSVIFMLTYPLEPSQISLISAFTIGIPGFLLALEPNKERIQGNFLRNVLLKALPAGLTDVLAVGALVVCGEVFSLPQEDIATAATMLLAVVGFMILVQISRPLSAMKYAILIGDALGLILCGIFLNQLFALNAMSEICVLLLIVFAFASESLFRNLSLLVRSIQSWLEKKREKRRS